MLFNFGKCKCLHTGPGNTGMNYEMGGIILSKTVKEKHLRVTMNASMKVSEQCRTAASKAGHRSNLASLRFRVNAATERRKHTQVDFLWITQRFRTIAVFPINWERLDAGVFMPTLPATRRKSRTCATRKTDVISERKHCSRRRRHTQVELSSSRKCADKTQTIARKRWHGARKRKRSNVRSTCGRLKGNQILGMIRRNITYKEKSLIVPCIKQ